RGGQGRASVDCITNTLGERRERAGRINGRDRTATLDPLQSRWSLHIRATAGHRGCDLSERSHSYVGAALSPRETRKLCLGRGSYIEDLKAPRLLHAGFVRSPHAHARIRRLDVGAARRKPGIAAVLTGEDVARMASPLRIAPGIEGLLPMEMPALPTDKVRFVGDLVACVIGEDRYQIEDACALVDVEYAPLAPVVDPEHAGDRGLPLVDEMIPANRAYHGVFAHGDVDTALGAADRVVEVRFHQGRQTHAPLEPR